MRLYDEYQQVMESIRQRTTDKEEIKNILKEEYPHLEKLRKQMEFLYKEHRVADSLLQQRKLECDGGIWSYEYDKEPFKKSHYKIRYIGLGMYHDVWNDELWSEAYRGLVDKGLLEENPDHGFHFRVLK